MESKLKSEERKKEILEGLRQEEYFFIQPMLNALRRWNEMNETLVGKINFNKVQATSDTPRTFTSGSVRDAREGKGRFDLVSPIAMKRLAQHYENGAKKYQDRNWEKGQPVMSYLDSAERHLNTLKEMKLKGLPLDEDHLSAIMWNIGAIIHVEEMVRCGLLPTELLDYPKPQPKLEGMTYNDPRCKTFGVLADDLKLDGRN